MDISVVIVSYNTLAMTLACIDSIYSAYSEKEIFVVDNASTDNSAEEIKKHFPEVNLIVNSENRGFGAANNQALKECSGRYVIFLNPDTKVKPETLQNAVAFMDANRQIGLAGAKILNPDGTIQESVSYRYPGEKYTSGETTNLQGKIACVLGAFMIARTELIKAIDVFDEDFFLYGEDQDLAWRIREKGYAIGYIENAEVFHWGGQSETETPPIALFEKKLRAEYLFYSKHYRPETIMRIKKAQKIKALYRLITLKLAMPFARNKNKLKNKYDCYRLVYDITKS
jgi:GT2 family glycosyltransferase